MCSSTVSSSLTIHVFRWRKLPLMFNSCHVTRLRRTSLRLLLFLFLRLHRGRCHELYKHVPPSRGKAFGTVVALEFGGDLRGEDRRKQTFVTLSLTMYVSQLFRARCDLEQQQQQKNGTNFLQRQRATNRDD